LLINTSCVIAGLRTTHQSPCTPQFELGEVSSRSSQAPKFGELLVRRPVAATALLPKSVVLFTAGAVAGALGMTCCPGLHLHLSQHVTNKLSNGPAHPQLLTSSIGAPRGHNDWFLIVLVGMQQGWTKPELSAAIF